MDVDPEIERPRNLTEMVSGETSWRDLGMRIKWTEPKCPGEIRLKIGEPVQLRVAIEMKKDIEHEQLAAYCWTNIKFKGNAHGVFKDIKLYENPKCKADNMESVTRLFVGSLAPAKDEVYRITYNIKWGGYMVWANGHGEDTMIYVSQALGSEMEISAPINFPCCQDAPCTRKVKVPTSEPLDGPRSFIRSRSYQGGDRDDEQDYDDDEIDAENAADVPCEGEDDCEPEFELLILLCCEKETPKSRKPSREGLSKTSIKPSVIEECVPEEETPEEVADEPIPEEPFEEPVEEPDAETSEKSIKEEPLVEVADEPIPEEPFEEPVEEPAAETNEEPTKEEISEELADEPIPEESKESGEEPAVEASEELTKEEISEELADEPIAEEPFEEPVEEPATETSEEPAEGSAEPPPEEAAENPTEEADEEKSADEEEPAEEEDAE